MTEQTLEERVAYLEENIQALNKAFSEIAVATKALMDDTQSRSVTLSNKLEVALVDICPFPPGC